MSLSTASSSRDFTTDFGQMMASGALDEAVKAAKDRVRAHPMDSEARRLLIQGLCVAGALEQAASQADILSQHVPAEAMPLALLRGLIRAEQAREAWFTEGAMPTFLDAPTPCQSAGLRLAVALRDQGVSEEDLTALVKATEETRPPCQGMCDGVAFDLFRDADDLFAHGFEALSHSGDYLWLATDSLTALRFAPVRRPLDLLWRQGEAVLRDGRSLTLFFPVSYWHSQSTAHHRLAAATDWEALPGNGSRGLGQRLFLVGEEARGMLEINTLTFEVSA